MLKTIGVILTLNIVLSVAPGTALAQHTTAVLGIEAGEAPGSMAANLSEALRMQVQQSSKFKLVSGKAIEEIKLVFGCVEESPNCMANAGRNMQAEKLIWGSLRAASVGYKFTIKMVDVAQARVEQQVSENIREKKLGKEKAVRIVQRMTKPFLGGDMVGEARISSNISGAQIKEGVQLLGITDENEPTILRDMTEGQHHLKIEKEGYMPWEQTVQVVSGSRTAVNAQLVRESEFAASPAPSSSSTGWRIAFWSGLAATAGLTTATILVGLSEINIEKENEDALVKYYPKPGEEPRYDMSDVCAARTDWGPPDDIQSICDKGKSRARMFNILLIFTGASAITTGFFYYKAYMSGETEGTADAGASVRRPSLSKRGWRLSPVIGAQNTYLKLAIPF